MAAFEHGDAGAKPRRLQRDRQAGKPRADHADVDIQSKDSRCAGGIAQRRYRP